MKETIKKDSYYRDVLKKFSSHKLAMLGLCILLVEVLLVVVLPIAMMIYTGQGSLSQITDLMSFGDLLAENGWSALTAANMLIFTLMHWPCATTLLSVKKESGSWKWTAVAAVLPLLFGMALCSITACIYRIIL